MNELSIFNYGKDEVRTVLIDGEPWFVAKDVAETLGYKWNGNKTIGHIPEEWRGVESVSTPTGNQELIVLSEQGLYFFLGRSDKSSPLAGVLTVVLSCGMILGFFLYVGRLL